MGKKSKKSREEIIAKRLAKAQAGAWVPRPFEGLPFEADLVCLRELVPAATATARLTEEYGGHDVTFASLLPAAWQALHRADGVLMAGLQVPFSSPDPSRDIAAALLAVAEAAPGTFREVTSQPGDGPRLQDILDLDVPFTVTVQETFDFWLPEDESLRDEEVVAALDQANEAISPTEKLVSAPAAYWTNMAGRVYVRWALTEPEETVLTALARLHAAGQNDMGTEGGRYLGCFRAHGIAVPVWEFDPSTQPDDLEEGLATFVQRFTEAAARTEPLEHEERRAKAGVVSRQLTIR